MARAAVEVPLSDAVNRRLPLVSVRSGRAADGYLGVPIGLGPWSGSCGASPGGRRGGPVVRLPLTQREFDQVLRLRQAERSGIVNSVVFLALAVALARFPLLFPLGLPDRGTVGGAGRRPRGGALSRAVPQVSVRAKTVKITGAHPDFASQRRRGRSPV